MKRQILLLAMWVAFVVWAPPLRAARVVVFAAASLNESLKLVAADYEQRSSDTIIFNFAASGTLARQIEEGAPVDLLFSADEAKMDVLEKQGLIVTGTRRRRLGNTLVMVAAPDGPAIHSPTDLTNAIIQRIALGDTKTVPAGTYAKAWLEKADLWRYVEPKVVPSESVRAVLAAVESGNVDVGVVYKTDAATSKKVKVIFEVPAAAGPNISYPIALVKNGPAAAAAKRFLDFLAGDEAGRIFTRQGFVVLPTAKR